MEFTSQGLKQSKPLTMQNIRKIVSDADIIHQFTGVYPRSGILVLSPLRQDSTPTVSFFQRGGKMCYKDFATGEFGDAFDMVSGMYGVSITESLHIINQKMNLGLGEGGKVIAERVEKYARQYKKPEKVKIQVEIKSYTNTELEYWKQFGISEKILKMNNVYSVDRVFMNRRLVAISKASDPIFCYHFPVSDNVKIYRPLNKQFKWFGNVTRDDIYGAKYFQEGRTLIITSSGKDAMTLQELGYMAVAPQGEGNSFSGDLVEMIKLSNKGFLFYDNDKAGKTNSKDKAIDFQLGEIFLPDDCGAKDPSDFVKLFGQEALKTYVNGSIKGT